MKKLSLFVFSFLLVILYTGTQVIAGGNDSPDKKFVKKAAIGGLMEVELGKYAQQNGTSQGVKDFGKMMETDHSKANNELKALAEKNNFTLPKKLDEKHMDMVKKLKSMKGAGFDKEYMDMMVEDHEKDIDEFQDAADKVQNSDLKNWINKTLPTLKNHLAEAKKVNDKLASK